MEYAGAIKSGRQGPADFTGRLGCSGLGLLRVALCTRSLLMVLDDRPDGGGFTVRTEVLLGGFATLEPNAGGEAECVMTTPVSVSRVSHAFLGGGFGL